MFLRVFGPGFTFLDSEKGAPVVDLCVVEPGLGGSWAWAVTKVGITSSFGDRQSVLGDTLDAPVVVVIEKRSLPTLGSGCACWASIL